MDVSNEHRDDREPLTRKRGLNLDTDVIFGAVQSTSTFHVANPLTPNDNQDGPTAF